MEAEYCTYKLKKLPLSVQEELYDEFLEKYKKFLISVVDSLLDKIRDNDTLLEVLVKSQEHFNYVNDRGRMFDCLFTVYAQKKLCEMFSYETFGEMIDYQVVKDTFLSWINVPLEEKTTKLVFEHEMSKRLFSHDGKKSIIAR